MNRILALLFLTLHVNLSLYAQVEGKSTCLQIILDNEHLKDELNNFELNYCDSSLHISKRNIDIKSNYYLNGIKLDTSNTESDKKCSWIYFDDLEKNKIQLTFKTPEYYDGKVGRWKQIRFEFKAKIKEEVCTIRKMKVVRRNYHAQYL